MKRGEGDKMRKFHVAANKGFSKTTFKKSIRRILLETDLTREQIVFYAWICAVRALPFMFCRGNLNFWPSDYWQKNLYAVFNALDYAWANDHPRKHLTYASKTAKAADAAAHAARSADTATAAANAIAVPFKATTAAKATVTAAFHAANATYAANAARAANTADDAAITYAADVAANTADAAYNANIIVSHDKYIMPNGIIDAMIDDIKLIKEGKSDTLEGKLDLYGGIWEKFKITLTDLKCGYWFEIYEQALSSNFNINRSELLLRLDIPDDVKDHGAAIVAKYMEDMSIFSESKNKTRIFVSYSWDSVEHRNNVHDFVCHLRSEDMNIIYDDDIELGERLSKFMEDSVRESDYVLLICTPSYKKKADKRKAGVGYENTITSGELYYKNNELKFIPILFSGSWEESMPNWATGKLGVDLREYSNSHKEYSKLVSTLRKSLALQMI